MSRIGEAWAGWQPGKAVLCWSCIATAVATIVVGFSWGGWVTGGTARSMAESTAQSARHELASALCVERFMRADDAVIQLTSLKEMPSFRQSSFIREGSWAVMPDGGQAPYQVASACAATLAALELPATDAAEDSTPEVIVQ
jgi:hypothetical protein